jgi:hypothetical protein
MTRTKYIVGKQLGTNFVTGVIFAETFDHSYFRDRFGEILGAGFCDIERTTINGVQENSARCWGSSYSLGNIKSRPEDAVILDIVLGLVEAY